MAVMAIYHFSAKVMSRAAGTSALAAAAYRSAGRLYDERLGRTHDFTHKAGVIHSEVMLPEGADEAWRDREKLWNDVEAAELRKDAQLAREIEFAIPRELDQAEGIRLARDFVQTEFVERGMVADLNVHWDIGEDGLAKPHAHVMLTMREVVKEADGEIGFGAKVRDWNRAELLTHWREAWAEHANARLAELDIEARIDHRSLAAQGIDLEPQNKIGAAAQRMLDQDLASERAAEHLAIAKANGERLLANPGLALDAITQQQATFTTRDLAAFVHRHSHGVEQFSAVMSAVQSAPDLVRLGRDAAGQERFTSRDMIATEERLHQAIDRMAERELHRVREQSREAAMARAASERNLVLSDEQATALRHVTDERVIETWAKPFERDAPAPVPTIKPQQLDMFERTELADPKRDAELAPRGPVPAPARQAEPSLPAPAEPKAKPRGRFEGLRLQVESWRRITRSAPVTRRGTAGLHLTPSRKASASRHACCGGFSLRSARIGAAIPRPTRFP